MKRLLIAGVLSLPLMTGCGGGSPEDEGRAYARSLITTLESGDVSAIQGLAEKAAAKAQGMSMEDAQKFMEGYNEVAMPYMQKMLGQ